jgi:glycosyltransferase involved in cell wall biosynthesis
MRIDIYGFFAGASGVGTHTRNFAAALARDNDVRAIRWERGGGAFRIQDGKLTAADPEPPAEVAISMTLDRADMVVGRYRIVVFAWETTRISARQRAVLLSFDEIWVPSHWGRAILIANQIPSASVYVIPEGADPRFFAPPATPPAGPFRFLCVGKWEERKGIAGLSRCFASTFSPEEEVELILHAHNPYIRGFSMESALAGLGLGPCPPIRPSTPVARHELAALYRACHAFVLPTRGEGWGLPILEAMACGLPTIATGYSATLDYLNESNGFPIRVGGMVPVDDPLFYRADEDWGDWAEPDWSHLAATMRFVFDHRDEARTRGARARADVLAHWTWEEAAAAANRRLAAARVNRRR